MACKALPERVDVSAKALKSVSGITCIGVFGCGDNDDEEKEEIIWLARECGGARKKLRWE